MFGIKSQFHGPVGFVLSPCLGVCVLWSLFDFFPATFPSLQLDNPVDFHFRKGKFPYINHIYINIIFICYIS